MVTWIPWEEVRAELMKRPGFAEGVEIARQELEAEIAAERMHAERAQAFFARYKTNRKTKRPFALHRPRARATA